MLSLIIASLEQVICYSIQIALQWQISLYSSKDVDGAEDEICSSTALNQQTNNNDGYYHTSTYQYQSRIKC
jgi:hypothetical protein